MTLDPDSQHFIFTYLHRRSDVLLMYEPSSLPEFENGYCTRSSSFTATLSLVWWEILAYIIEYVYCSPRLQ